MGFFRFFFPSKVHICFIFSIRSLLHLWVGWSEGLQAEQCSLIPHETEYARSGECRL